MAVPRAFNVSVKKGKSNRVTDLEAECSSPAVTLSRLQSYAGLAAQAPTRMLVLLSDLWKSISDSASQMQALTYL